MQLIGYRDSGQDRVGSLNDDDTVTRAWHHRRVLAQPRGGGLRRPARGVRRQCRPTGHDRPARALPQGAHPAGYGGAFEPGERIRDAVAQALHLVAAGRAGLGIGRRFTLREGAAAFAAVQHRTPGKILLDIAG